MRSDRRQLRTGGWQCGVRCLSEGPRIYRLPLRLATSTVVRASSALQTPIRGFRDIGRSAEKFFLDAVLDRPRLGVVHGTDADVRVGLGLGHHRQKVGQRQRAADVRQAVNLLLDLPNEFGSFQEPQVILGLLVEPNDHIDRRDAGKVFFNVVVVLHNSRLVREVPDDLDLALAVVQSAPCRPAESEWRLRAPCDNATAPSIRRKTSR